MTTVEQKEKWLNLYTLAKEYQQLAPWKWMGDAQIFGVEHPTTKSLYFCVVFGRGGVVYGLNVYKGVAGLDSYLGILKGSQFENPIFTQQAVALAFENRENLTKEDYQHIKSLGLKFRGKNNWIQFLDYTPGYQPWLIAKEQIDTVRIAIEQTMEVAKMVKADPDLILDDYLMINHTNDILIRRKINGNWKNTFEDSEKLLDEWELQEEENEIVFSEQLMKILKDFKAKFPVEQYVLINGFEYFPTVIQENKSLRPYYPTIALWIDYNSEAILSQQIGDRAETLQLLYKSLLGIIQHYKKIPTQIVATNDWAYEHLWQLEDIWGIEVISNPDDGTAKNIIAELVEYMW